MSAVCMLECAEIELKALVTKLQKLVLRRLNASPIGNV
jgi:hypothetical protein